uniref:Uncharacterized protein n=1 Tax=Arundo donax TaxID=35708 RepID=A0A0A9ADI1_ARUDO
MAKKPRTARPAPPWLAKIPPFRLTVPLA